jgi:hypothetical protein
MVEIYFNAQSDNGTLTSSKWTSSGAQFPFRDADVNGQIMRSKCGRRAICKAYSRQRTPGHRCGCKTG